MGFLDGLKAVLGGRAARDAAERRRLAKLWGLEEENDEAGGTASAALDPDALPPVETSRGVASEYDQRMWVKKLRHLLTVRVPVDAQEWEDFRADGLALGFDEAWIQAQERSAFEFLLRKVVSDGVVTEEERQTLDLARRQIKLSEPEATAMLEAVAKEAAALFGRAVEGA